MVLLQSTAPPSPAFSFKGCLNVSCEMFLRISLSLIQESSRNEFWSVLLSSITFPWPLASYVYSAVKHYDFHWKLSEKSFPGFDNVDQPHWPQKNKVDQGSWLNYQAKQLKINKGAGANAYCKVLFRTSLVNIRMSIICILGYLSWSSSTAVQHKCVLQSRLFEAKCDLIYVNQKCCTFSVSKVNYC